MRSDLLHSGDVPESTHRIVILGGGLAGLTSGLVLGDDAVVLEAEDTPGGLVRSVRIGDYWFDRVIHLLHFRDDETEARIKQLDDLHLGRCIPDPWVVTDHGTVRYPFQMHLGGLDREATIACLRDFASARFGGSEDPPKDYDDLLRRSFGATMYETFFGPYNRKMWKRPLETLAPSGFTWNISYPDFDAVTRGVLEPNSPPEAYNTNGWYPRPPADAPVRGMEVLSQALAKQVPDLRLEHRVDRIDPENRCVLVETPDGWHRFRYEEACINTLPLPLAIAQSAGVPDAIRRACSELTYNRVWSVALCIEGPRPEGFGQWRYYTDESLAFTRLIYMNGFDPDASPAGTWGLLAEIPEPNEAPLADPEAVIRRIIDDVTRIGLPGGDGRIVDSGAWVETPAYVVFTTDNQDSMALARDWLLESDIHPLGRYGRWEYSSMAQVMRDSFAVAENLREALAPRGTTA